jgi:hypothetical protein
MGASTRTWAAPRFPLQKSDDSVQQRFTRAQAPAVLGNDRHAALECLGGDPTEMRRYDDVRQAEEGVVCADGLTGKYIKTSTAQMPARHCLEKRGLVNERTSRGVDEDGAALHHGKGGGVDYSCRLRGQNIRINLLRYRCSSYRSRHQMKPIIPRLRWAEIAHVPVRC